MVSWWVVAFFGPVKDERTSNLVLYKMQLHMYYSPIEQCKLCTS